MKTWTNSYEFQQRGPSFLILILASYSVANCKSFDMCYDTE